MITCYIFEYNQKGKVLEVKIEDKLNKFLKEHPNIIYSIKYVPFKDKLVVVIDWEYYEVPKLKEGEEEEGGEN